MSGPGDAPTLRGIQPAKVVLKVVLATGRVIHMAPPTLGQLRAKVSSAREGNAPWDRLFGQFELVADCIENAGVDDLTREQFWAEFTFPEAKEALSQVWAICEQDGGPVAAVDGSAETAEAEL